MAYYYWIIMIMITIITSILLEYTHCKPIPIFIYVYVITMFILLEYTHVYIIKIILLEWKTSLDSPIQAARDASFDAPPRMARSERKAGAPESPAGYR